MDQKEMLTPEELIEVLMEFLLVKKNEYLLEDGCMVIKRPSILFPDELDRDFAMRACLKLLNKYIDLDIPDMPIPTKNARADLYEYLNWAKKVRKITNKSKEQPGMATGVRNAREQQQTQKKADSGGDAIDKAKTIIIPSQCENYAWESYKWVLDDKPDLLPKEDYRKVQNILRWYSKEMYNHLIENGPFYANDPKKPRDLPSYGTWTRYLRRYEELKNSLGDNKPTISDQPESSVRRQDVHDRDLCRLSSRFDIDNPD